MRPASHGFASTTSFVRWRSSADTAVQSPRYQVMVDTAGSRAALIFSSLFSSTTSPGVLRRQDIGLLVAGWLRGLPSIACERNSAGV